MSFQCFFSIINKYQPCGSESTKTYVKGRITPAVPQTHVIAAPRPAPFPTNQLISSSAGVERWTLCDESVGICCPKYSRLTLTSPPALPQQANISVVVVDSDAKITTLLSQRPRPLSHIVSIRPVKPELVQRAKDAGIKVSRFTEVEKLGAAANIKELVSM